MDEADPHEAPFMFCTSVSMRFTLVSLIRWFVHSLVHVYKVPQMFLKLSLPSAFDVCMTPWILGANGFSLPTAICWMGANGFSRPTAACWMGLGMA